MNGMVKASGMVSIDASEKDFVVVPGNILLTSMMSYVEIENRLYGVVPPDF
jgi:hypothetical protein